MNDHLKSYLLGVFMGFMAGSSLAIAICLTFGNAFPDWK